MNSLEKKVAEKKRREEEFSFNLDNLPPLETPKTLENSSFSDTTPIFPEKTVPINIEKPKEVYQPNITSPEPTPTPKISSLQEFKTTLNSLKKTFKAQTLSVSTKNLAFLDVVSGIKNESQKDFLDKILNEYFEKQNYDSEILKLVQNKIELIEANIHKK